MGMKLHNLQFRMVFFFTPYGTQIWESHRRSGANGKDQDRISLEILMMASFILSSRSVSSWII